FAVAEVPFAHDCGGVAGLFEGLRQEPLVCGQAVRHTRGNNLGLQAIAKRISARHQCSPCRCTHGLNIELLEPRPPLRKLIDGWPLYIRAVESNVLPAKVVGENVDDVGALRTLLRSGRQLSEQKAG